MKRFILFFFCIHLFVLEASQKEKEIVSQIFLEADVQIEGDRPWDIEVHDDAFYTAILKDGSLGLGESYMSGFWDSKELDSCIFHILRADLEKKIKPTFAMKWAVFKAKFLNRQSRSGSLDVIDLHYQLGNDLFENMLDSLMTYSCGYFSSAQSLNEAQETKYDLIARKLGVEVRVQDYREVKETFDRVVEIGMFEHVGEKNYRTFMEIANRCLKENGMLMLHTIGRNTSSPVCDSWIDKYIFPGGQLPSISQVGTAIEGLFVMEDWHNFGVDYDKTLLHWFQNFDSHWTQLQPFYPPFFYRMWKYYLLSCSGAFRARDIQLWQVVLSKGGVLGGYKTVR